MELDPAPENETSPILPKLPYDVVSLILEYTTIGHVITTILYCGSHLSQEERQGLAIRRNDPRRILRPLTSDPDKLLDAMRIFRVVLSGSRALDYFNPGCAVSTSDYDFYGGDDERDLGLFLAYMEWLGTCWVVPENGGYVGDGLNVLHGILSRGGKDITIQFIWRANNTASECVMQFHSTAPQCFISGFAAVSLYHKLTSKYLAYEWFLNNNRGETDNMDESDVAMKRAHDLAIEKYKGRGFTFVDLLHKGQPASQDKGRHRQVGDNDSWIVPFDTYLDTSVWLYDLETFIEHLRYCSWREYRQFTRISSDSLRSHIPTSSSLPIFNICEQHPNVMNPVLDLVSTRPWYEIVASQLPADNSRYLPC